MKMLSAFLRDLIRRARHPIGSVREQFLAPKAPFDLAVLRILVYGYVLSMKPTYGNWADQMSDCKPVGIFALIHMPSQPVLGAMHAVGLVGATLCLLGVLFRPAAIAVALTLPYLMGVPNNFGKVDHANNLLAVLLCVLAFSRAADALSLDAWWRRRRGGALPEACGEYRWPIAATWLLISGMYSSAGFSKLFHTGWSWALSDNLQLLMLRHYAFRDPITPIGYYLAQSEWVCQAVALAALIGELACPLMLLGGGWTLVFGGGMVCLQFGIYLLLGVSFKSMAFVFAALVPWHALWGWLARRVPGVTREAA